MLLQHTITTHSDEKVYIYLNYTRVSGKICIKYSVQGRYIVEIQIIKKKKIIKIIIICESNTT